MAQLTDHLIVPERPGHRWLFPLTRDELLVAAKRRAKWHRGRLAHWRKEFARIKKKLPTTITVENQEWATKNMSNSSYRPAGLAIDPKLADEFQQCVGKIAEHQKLAEEFERWSAVFGAYTKSRVGVEPPFFDCTIADITHFGVYDVARYTSGDERSEAEK